MSEATAESIMECLNMLLTELKAIRAALEAKDKK